MINSGYGEIPGASNICNYHYISLPTSCTTHEVNESVAQVPTFEDDDWRLGDFVFQVIFCFRLLLAQMAIQNPNTRFQHEKLIRFSR